MGRRYSSCIPKEVPKSNNEYSQYCHKNSNLLGTSFIIESDQPNILIACLFTSDFNQTPEQIVHFTKQSIADLARKVSDYKEVENVMVKLL